MIGVVIINLRKDIIRLFRNNMLLYGILFPIVLAVGMRAFMPGMQDLKLTMAVDATIEQSVLEGLSSYAQLELYDSPDKVKERVEKPDDLAGIIKDQDKYVILLEGNETGEAEEIASAIMNNVLAKQNQAIYEHISLNKSNTTLNENSVSLLLLTVILIGGFIVGFNIVEDKESKMMNALAVSPLRLLEYILSHTIVCIIISVCLGYISIIIFLGKDIDYLHILIGMIMTTGIALLFGYIVGIFANNLLSAIAVIKSITGIFLGVPIGSLFVPLSFQWVFFIFPHYWAFQVYRNIFTTNELVADFYTSSIIALLSSIFGILLLVPLMKKRFKLA